MQSSTVGAASSLRRAVTRRFAVVCSAFLGLLSCTSDQTTQPRSIAPTVSAKQLGLSASFDAFTFLPFLLDVQGANDQPNQVDLNGFTRADNVAGRLGVAWTWDDINSWTGTGQTGDACALFDTPTDKPVNGFANFAICVRITNDASGANVLQLNPGSPIIYSCGDKKTDRCSQDVNIVPLGSTFCEVTKTNELFPGVGDDGQDVLAACSIDLAAIGATSANILNVCSFPSGQPNSNAFDCIVTPGAGFLRIAKKTTPDVSGTTFNFTLSPGSANGTTSFSVTDNSAGDETTGLIALTPGTYGLTETSIPSAWQLTAASCLRGGTATGTKSGDAVTGITATTGETIVCTFENLSAPPSLTVEKTANPTSIPETGGNVEYTVLVKNTATTAVTLTTLTDDKFGDLAGQGDCTVPQTLAVSGQYSCKFTRTLAAATAGATHKNIVTATVTSAGGSASNTDDAVVTYADVAPTVTVVKTASPTSVPETGGSVAYTVVVTNGPAEAVTLTSLSDDKFGNLNGKGNCVTGGSLAAGAQYSCTFNQTIAGNAGTTHKNIVTVLVTDNDESTATNTDDAVVTFTDVLPTLTVTKTPSPTSVPETGGSVQFTVAVHNTSAEAVTLTTLSDDRFGNLNAQGTCLVNSALAAGATYSCQFSKTLSGNAGTFHKDTVTATIKDDDNSTATEKAGATVTFTNVNPNISVTKTANPTSISNVAAGTLTFTADRTYLVTPPPGSGFNFAAPTCDDAGPNDVPAQTDLNCFNRADNIPNRLGVRWSWDDINSWSGSGQSGDACALIDTNNDGNANVAVCARIKNAADGSVIQIGGAGAVDIYSCTDSKPDRCAKQVTQVLGADKGATTCGISVVSPDQLAGGEDGADVLANCSIDLTMPILAGATSRNLLNVCSFPSGEPNSNPFDCVVTPGAAFIQITKVTGVTTTQLFGFTMSIASTDGSSKYAVQSGVSTELLAVKPGTNYALTETMPTNWSLSSVSCTVGGTATGTANVAQSKITGIEAKTGQTTFCTFTNAGSLSGLVTYTITVNNLTAEAVSLFSLNDDKFGDLNGVGNCATGGTIAGSGSYTCTFTKTLTGAAGTSHTNTVTAVAKDDELNSVSKTASATVNFVASP